MASRGWTCRRCGVLWPRTKQKCVCGCPRPKRRRPAHLAALELDYAGFVELNGGEFCAICKRPPGPSRRLDRDHCHRTGRPRGLLCARCNRALPSWQTPGWLRAAADYLERDTP